MPIRSSAIGSTAKRARWPRSRIPTASPSTTSEAKKQGRKLDPEVARKHCGRMVVRGCTDPPQKNQEIILKYVDPVGNVTFHTVKTDANGCYEDFFVSVTGGTWQVTAEYPGGKCEAPGREGPVTVCWCF